MKVWLLIYEKIYHFYQKGTFLASLQSLKFLSEKSRGKWIMQVHTQHTFRCKNLMPSWFFDVFAFDKSFTEYQITILVQAKNLDWQCCQLLFSKLHEIFAYSCFILANFFSRFPQRLFETAENLIFLQSFVRILMDLIFQQFSNQGCGWQ